MSAKTEKVQGHTPGPWEFELHLPPHSADGEFHVVDPASDNRDVIAIVDPDGIRSELDDAAEANARLIAAAPELLAACKAMFNAILDLAESAGDVPEFNEGGCAYESNRLAEAAIAKVEGRDAVRR